MKSGILSNLKYSLPAYQLLSSHTRVCSTLTFDTRKTKSVADLRDTNSVADLSIFELPNTAVSASCICVPQPEKCKLEIVKFRAFIAIMPNSLTQ